MRAGQSGMAATRDNGNVDEKLLKEKLWRPLSIDTLRG